VHGQRASCRQKRTPDGPQVEGDQLGSWETGGRTPRLATVDLLCEYYECTPFDLGLGSSGAPTRGPRRCVRTQSAATTEPDEARLVPPLLGDHLDAARRSADRDGLCMGRPTHGRGPAGAVPALLDTVNPYGRFELDMNSRLDLVAVAIVPGPRSPQEEAASAPA
jgi:hypothetical protein